MKKLTNQFKNWNLINFYSCKLSVIDTTIISENKNQLRSLHITVKNCLFLYINGKRIPKNYLIQAKALNGKNYIAVKAVGLFQSKKIHVPVGEIQIKSNTNHFKKNQSFCLAPYKLHNHIQKNEASFNVEIKPITITNIKTAIHSNKASIISKSKSYQLKQNHTNLKLIINQ